MLKIIALALVAFSLAANAEQLDLAVVQFPEVKTVADLESALSKVNLTTITNADRTMTSESYLKGGYVIFTQSLPLSGRFASSTRLSNNRADVQGAISGGHISVTITVSEGVDAGLRRFTSRTYQASAPLSPGQPRVLGIRQVTGKSTSTVRGQSTSTETTYSYAIIGQITK